MPFLQVVLGIFPTRIEHHFQRCRFIFTESLLRPKCCSFSTLQIQKLFHILKSFWYKGLGYRCKNGSNVYLIRSVALQKQLFLTVWVSLMSK